MRYALKVAYDGRSFHGFARQPKVETVEGKILDILKNNGFITDARLSRFRYASRTDRGVSSLGNVIAFDTSKRLNIDDLKTMNTDDIYFYGIKEVDKAFYPRHARMRWYRYYLKDSRNLEGLLRCANLFVGVHNFSNFARVEKNRNPIREIKNIVIEQTADAGVIIDFYARTFLWQQVRRMVSAMKKVADGSIEENEIREALSNPEKRVDFGIASPFPLILKDVIYDFDFIMLKNSSLRLKEMEKDIISSI